MALSNPDFALLANFSSNTSGSFSVSHLVGNTVLALEDEPDVLEMRPQQFGLGAAEHAGEDAELVDGERILLDAAAAVLGPVLGGHKEPENTGGAADLTEKNRNL